MNIFSNVASNLIYEYEKTHIRMSILLILLCIHLVVVLNDLFKVRDDIPREVAWAGFVGDHHRFQRTCVYIR